MLNFTILFITKISLYYKLRTRSQTIHGLSLLSAETIVKLFRSLRDMKSVERMMQVIDLLKFSIQSDRVSVEPRVKLWIYSRRKVSQYKMISQMERI